MGSALPTPNKASSASKQPTASPATPFFVTVVLLAAIAMVPLTLGWAQATITVTPATTYQTWRGFGQANPGKVYPLSGPPCVSATMPDAVWNNMVNYITNDLRASATLLPVFHAQGLEASANDNSDPFNINQPAFDVTFTTPYNGQFGCPQTTDAATGLLKSVRDSISAAGLPNDTTLTFYFYRNGPPDMPPWWAADVNEGSEAYHATINWIHNNHGFYPEYADWNEPSPAGSGQFFIAGGGSADYMGGWIKSLHDRLASAGIPTRMQSPTSEFSSQVIGDLNNINTVAGAEADISRLNFHLYDGVNSATLQAIAARAATDHVEVSTNEHAATAADGTYSGALSAFVSDFFPLLQQAKASMFGWDGPVQMCFSNPGCTLSIRPNSGWSGVGIETDASTFYLQPFYYLLRQFTRYVAPGDVRVAASSNNGNVWTTSWERPDGTLVVHILNNTGSTQSVTVTGLPNQSFDIHKLDPSMCTTTGPFRCTPDDSATATPSGGSLTVSMVNGAVWTLAQVASPSLQNFSMTVSPAIATASLAQAATYTLTISPINGFNQAVSIGCTGGPASVGCTATPSSVTLTGSSASTVTVTATTTAASMHRFVPTVEPPSVAKGIFPWLLWLLATLTWTWAAISPHRKRRIRLGNLFLGVVLLLLALTTTLAGCSTGGSTGAQGGGSTLTFTGTASTVSHTVTVSLTVQ